MAVATSPEEDLKYWAGLYLAYETLLVEQAGATPGSPQSCAEDARTKVTRGSTVELGPEAEDDRQGTPRFEASLSGAKVSDPNSTTGAPARDVRGSGKQLWQEVADGAEILGPAQQAAELDAGGATNVRATDVDMLGADQADARDPTPANEHGEKPLNEANLPPRAAVQDSGGRRGSRPHKRGTGWKRRQSSEPSGTYTR